MISPSWQKIAHYSSKLTLDSSKLTLAWLEIFSGGIGGMVARSRPGRDPRPLEMRTQLEAWIAEQDAPAPETVEDYGAAWEDGRVQIATDADVAFVSAHLTEVALDALLDRQPSAFEGNTFLLGLQKDWVFTAPFQVIALNLRPPATPESVTSPEAREEMQDFVLNLLEESRDTDHATGSPEE